MTQQQNIERNVGFLIHDLARLMRKSFDRRLEPLGMTRSQWWVLAFVFRQQGLTQSELADVLDIGKVALGGLLDRLEAKNWIERRADDNDRRIKRIYLAPQATPVIKSMTNPAQDLIADALTGLTPTQQAALTDMLLVVKKNLTEDDPVAGRAG
ncbi:MAG: MarR family transcriptional regulator [Alphaproteobacteria bacterium]|jgi:DNA-binding MarR family transcriptional regulator|nr:MarR family transcriptional regulator [Alphaproteobacteria bacterium]MDP6515318.1 MarR family transcriptional regulator [Alphaproteobacteria bacterium]|tara:strand:+ start:92 stop:553 length:462 start_codon:yes stop_codon:yes gene_type:complete